MCQFQISNLDSQQWDKIVIKSNGDYRQFYKWVK